MSVTQDFFQAIRQLSALEARTSDVANYVQRVEAKVDNIIDRLSRVEAHQEHLRQNIRNEILADIKADLARYQVIREYEQTAPPTIVQPGAKKLEGTPSHSSQTKKR